MSYKTRHLEWKRITEEAAEELERQKAKHRNPANNLAEKQFKVQQLIAERNFIVMRDHTYFDPKTKTFKPR